MKEYSQAICNDFIYCDGEQMTTEEVVEKLNDLEKDVEEKTFALSKIVSYNLILAQTGKKILNEACNAIKPKEPK